MGKNTMPASITVIKHVLLSYVKPKKYEIQVVCTSTILFNAVIGIHTYVVLWEAQPKIAEVGLFGFSCNVRTKSCPKFILQWTGHKKLIFHEYYF